MGQRALSSLLFMVMASGALLSVNAQVISGTVAEKGTQKKIAGAIVTRTADLSQAITDVNGNFSFGTASIKSPITLKNNGLQFIGTDICFSLIDNEQVTIRRFTPDGRQHATIFSGNLAKGNHAFRTSRVPCAAGLYLLQVSIGQNKFVGKMALNGSVQFRPGTPPDASLARQAMTALAIAPSDTLHVWADRYLNSITAIVPGTTVYPVELTPLPSSTLDPIASPYLVIEEKSGLVAVEAEHFVRQTKTDVRAWYLNSIGHIPAPEPDHDTATAAGAGGKAYMEVTPDTFHKDGDSIIPGVNLSRYGGDLAVLEYKVWFTTTGRYYLWTRTRSNDQEDNTITGGIDGKWPKVSDILQHPVETKVWNWNNLTRNPVSVADGGDGTTNVFYDIATPGLHTILFSMREDGEEFDRFFLTTNKTYANPGSGVGPASSTARAGVFPASF